MLPMAVLPSLRIAEFRFVPEAAVRLQPFSGSAWRGAFGHALKRLVCAAGLRPCEGCALAADCLFPRFFGGEGAADAARPFVLAPAPTPRRGWLAAGEALPVRLTLLPGAERAAPYATRALVEAAARRLRGLGFATFAELGKTARSEAAALGFARARLGWLETTRHSTRQGTTMQLGGIVGEAELDLRGTSHVWPLLWAGTVLHLGKGSSMGFGRVEAVPA